MKVRILKAFPYAHDGISIKMLAEEAIEEVRDELVEKLQDAGLVGPVRKPRAQEPKASEPKDPAPQVPVPAAPPVEPPAGDPPLPHDGA